MNHGARDVILCVEIDYEPTSNFCIVNFHVLAITNMVAVQNFEVISDKFNVVGICTSEDYVQKWTTK
jgi:hypothetical protein